MRIGIFELINDEVTTGPGHWLFDFFITKQSASIMPQAVSTWCRQLGHDVYYAVYYGQKDPMKLIPNDLDIIFISCFSKGSGLAYSLARLLKKVNPNILTVLGGAHAKQFSVDASRFFDLVVQDCDRQLIREILMDKPRNEIISSNGPPDDMPGIEERLPEIRISSFWHHRPTRLCFIPTMSSLGCPYNCEFCVDWDSDYQPLPLERVKADLEFIANTFPQVKINFYDPNFGVNFNKVMAVIESIDHPRKKWFLTEGSLNSLTEERLKRMSLAGCLCVIPGIESWNEYSKKSGMLKIKSAWDKLNKVVSHFHMIREYIPMIQANLMFGLDTDMGQDPVRLNKAFIDQTPYVSHTLNIPAPFGATPMFRKYWGENRILKSLPFAFYSKPFLATTILHYHPIEYYEKLIETFEYMTSLPLVLKAFKTTQSSVFKGYHIIRNIVLRQMINTMKEILMRLRNNRSFRQFHEGKNDRLPDYYHQLYESLLGRYKSVLSPEERYPLFGE